MVFFEKNVSTSNCFMAIFCGKSKKMWIYCKFGYKTTEMKKKWIYYYIFVGNLQNYKKWSILKKTCQNQIAFMAIFCRKSKKNFFYSFVSFQQKY